MLFMTTYSFRPEHRDAAVARLKETQGAPPPGVKLLGRWHDVSGNRGFALSESSDAQALFKWVLNWSDLIDFEVKAVLDDAEFAKTLGA